jgi:S-adenosyl methyltransferase
VGWVEGVSADVDGSALWEPEVGRDWLPPDPPSELPHPLRMWDYIIGGKDNYQADRDAVDYILKLVPDVRLISRSAEAFLHRAIAWIAQPEQGLHQFLHVGCFVPTMNSFDGIARRHSPGSPFVYVTDDQVSAAHARGVLAAQARGSGEVHALWAEFRDPAPILADPWLHERLDFSRPMGVLLFGMLDYTADEARLARALAEVKAALAPGSLIVVLHLLAYPNADAGEQAGTSLGPNPFQYTPRPMERVRELLSDFEFVEPGFVLCSSWRPDGGGPDASFEDRCHIAGGVAIVR